MDISIKTAYPSLNLAQLKDGIKEAREVKKTDEKVNEMVITHPHDCVVFTINKSEQENLNYPSLIATILRTLGLPENTPVIQFIGDGSTFTFSGSKIVKEEMLQLIKSVEDSHNGLRPLVLWGYTGAKKTVDGETLVDVNQAVNEIVDENPELANFFMANITEKSTVKTIENYGSTVATYAKNFFHVLDSKFGEDTPASDKLAFAGTHSFEGGPISMLQIVHCLKDNIPVSGRYGDIRAPRVAKDGSPILNEDGTAFDGFSAFRFWAELGTWIKSNREVRIRNPEIAEEIFSEETLAENFKEAFLKAHPLSEPGRDDNGRTDRVNEAWAIAMEHRLWERAPLIKVPA